MSNDFGGQSVMPDSPPAQDEKTFAILAHVLTTFCCGIGGLVIWLMKKDQSRFVAENAKHALFFWLAVFAFQIGLGIVGVLVAFVLPPVALLFNAVSLLVMLVQVGYTVLGAIRANEGKIFKYPIIGNYVK